MKGKEANNRPTVEVSNLSGLVTGDKFKLSLSF